MKTERRNAITDAMRRVTLRITIRDAMKRKKEDVQYSKGKPQAHCSLCIYYHKDGTCDRVQGNIAPQMWCNQFEHR